MPSLVLLLLTGNTRYCRTGIAEALIATAIGLFAAIPAVLAFNHFTAKGEALYSDRALFAEEMVALLQRQSVGPAQEAE